MAIRLSVQYSMKPGIRFNVESLSEFESEIAAERTCGSPKEARISPRGTGILMGIASRL
jgi:hypothetical protein